MSVYANGNEISSKSSANKTIAAMPDVCLSPPSPPAGPIPLPYPNTAMASDTTDGSKSVKIKGKEAGLKNQSSYKKSMGDEAATKGLGMGVISHNIQGKMKFAAWSFDVQFEGLNVTRHMDLTTHNHMNQAQNPGMNASKVSPSQPSEDCKQLAAKNEEARDDLKKETADKSLVGPNGNGKGTTVSSGKYRTRARTAHSNGKALEKCSAKFVAGGKPANREKGKSNLCAAAKYKHGEPAMQKSGHAEARLLDDLFADGASRSGQMTFNIDWRPRKGKKSKMPCAKKPFVM